MHMFINFPKKTWENISALLIGKSFPYPYNRYRYGIVRALALF